MTDAVALQIGADILGRLDALTHAVERVAAVMELSMSEPAPDEPMGCQHPDDMRIEFSGGTSIEWECRACGLHYGPVDEESIANFEGAHVG